MFDTIIGNEPIKTYLRKVIDQLPHALLFFGPEGVGKSLFAKEIASHLVGSETHPDFHVFYPDGKSALHTIETMKGLIADVHKAPFEAPSKVFLIHDAHRMQPAAANALLKTLEEPEPDTLLILLTSNIQEMLPTILSRCNIVKFQPLAVSEIAEILSKNNLPAHYANLAHGSAALAFQMVEIAPLHKTLFLMLSEKLSYPELALSLEKIEKEADHEDPMKKTSNFEYIFSSILMWHRDQIAKLYGAPLFFPDAPSAPFALPPLSEIEKRVEEARFAVSRNIRLSHSLEKIFLC